MDQPSATPSPTHNVQPWLPHRYWGKARPASINATAWHPLPYHALAVAVAAMRLGIRTPNTKIA